MPTAATARTGQDRPAPEICGDPEAAWESSFTRLDSLLRRSPGNVSTPARDLGPRIAALVLDTVDRLVDALPLPSVQHRFQRRVTVGDVAVESFRRQGAKICRRVRRSMMSRLGDEQPSWW
jgi:hypothetical protein